VVRGRISVEIRTFAGLAANAHIVGSTFAVIPTRMSRSEPIEPEVENIGVSVEDHAAEARALRSLLAETVAKLEAALDRIAFLEGTPADGGVHELALSPSQADHERALAYLSGRWSGNIYKSDAECLAAEFAAVRAEALRRIR
jgi:hypothetical protein